MTQKITHKKLGRRKASEIYWALIKTKPDIQKAIKILDEYYEVTTRFKDYYKKI